MRLKRSLLVEEPEQFNVDKPFLILIITLNVTEVNNVPMTRNYVLFSGKVLKPTLSLIQQHIEL